jgi:hypothetical protein
MRRSLISLWRWFVGSPHPSPISVGHDAMVEFWLRGPMLMQSHRIRSHLMLYEHQPLTVFDVIDEERAEAAREYLEWVKRL